MRADTTAITHEESRHISLCETLDRVLNKGAVVTGEVVITVANVDLIYLALQLVLTSIETASAPGEASAGRKPVISIRPAAGAGVRA